MKRAAPVQPVDVEDDVADDAGDLGEQLGELAADHPAHDLARGRCPATSASRDRDPVAHDRHAVAEGEDLVEAVADEDDRRTAVAQPSGHVEQPLGLGGRQRRRRLVHHDDAGIGRERLGDLDELLVADREALGTAVGVERDAELVEERRRGLAHRRPVDGRPLRGWRPTKTFSARVRSGNRLGSW